MTEDLENVEQGSDAPLTEAEAVTEDNEQQPIYNKMQMQDVVNREKRKAFERGKKEALMQMQTEQQQQMPAEAAPVQQAPQQQQAPGMLGGMQQMDPAMMERMIAEKAQQALKGHLQQMKNDHSLTSFVQ